MNIRTYMDNIFLRHSNIELSIFTETSNGTDVKTHFVGSVCQLQGPSELEAPNPCQTP